VLHYFTDGLADQERYGLGHRSVLEVTDFSVTFMVIDGDKAGRVGYYVGSADPGHLAERLRPAESCGPDCHRGL
jgi:hypothetical protein